MRTEMKGKGFVLILLLISISFFTLNAQWVRTYGGDGDDRAKTIQQTSDGGYIVLGNTISFGFGSSDIWILKLASDGSIEWEKTYGEDGVDEGASIEQTLDGGYIVAARSESFSPASYDVLILKLASDGSIEWQKLYGGDDSDGAYSVQQTNDGGYIVAGYTTFYQTNLTDFWIIKLSSNGNIEWNRTYGESLRETAYSIQQTFDGGYIVGGTIESFGAGSIDVWIVKLASDGTVEWQKAYGERDGEGFSSVRQTIDGGYIVAGSIIFFGAGQYDFWIFKLSSEGDIEWNKTFGGNLGDRPSSIQPTFDGGYIVAGTTESYGMGSFDIWILKLSFDGTIEWEKTYGGSQREGETYIQETLEGGYIVAGSTASYGVELHDMLVLKLLPNGDINPSCVFIGESTAEISDLGDMSVDTPINGVSQEFSPVDSSFLTQDSESVGYSLCSGQRTLTLTASEGGTTVPEPGTYVFDFAERARMDAEPDEGFFFIGWSGDVFDTVRSLLITMNSDKFVKANFEEDIIEEIWEEAKKTPCFIATAAFGSPMHPYVRTLQDFRDRYLLPTRLGRKFVKLYYKYSPSIANLIANHKTLRMAVRLWLIPVVALGYSMVHFGPAPTGLIFTLALLPFIVFVLNRRRKSR